MKTSFNCMQHYIKKISDFSKTRSFYNALTTLLQEEDEVSQATFYVLIHSDPRREISEGDIEKRSVALKMLDRINIIGSINSKTYEALCNIAKFDNQMNVILAIKCFESLYTKGKIPNESTPFFIESLCSFIQGIFGNIKENRYENLVLILDPLFFFFELLKTLKFYNPSIKVLLNEIESISSRLITTVSPDKIIQNRVNYVVFKFLGFFVDFSKDPAYDRLTEHLLIYLQRNINDESKELYFNLLSKIQSLPEKFLSVVYNDTTFFFKSEYIEIKAFGIKSLIKILKGKQGTKKIFEDLQATMHGSIQNLGLRLVENLKESDLKTMMSLVDSLSLLNKHYISEILHEKQKFKRRSFSIIGTAFNIFFEILETEKIPECLLTFLGSLLTGAEDFIAFLHDSSAYSRELPILSCNTLAAEDVVIFERLFRLSISAFTHKELEAYGDRFFKLFLHLNTSFIDVLLRTYADKIICCTEKSSSLFVLWNVFMNHQKSAQFFGISIFSKLLNQVATCDNNFYLSALKIILSHNKYAPPHFEKMLLSNPILKDFSGDYETMYIIFKSIKPCYNDFTTIPKVLYEKIDTFLDVLITKSKYDVDNELYPKIALTIPLSMSLLLHYFVKLAFFIEKALKLNGEVQMAAFQILENSFDSISTEIFLEVPSETMDSIVDSLIQHSKEGLYAITATQLLAKFHGPLKKFINNGSKVINTIYPPSNIPVVMDDVKINIEFLIQKCIGMIRGEFVKIICTKTYTSTMFLYTFRATHLSEFNLEAKKAANALILNFLYRTFGWSDFEKDDIYSGACYHIDRIIHSADFITPKGVSAHKSFQYARLKNINAADFVKHQHYIYDALLCEFKMKEIEFLQCVYSVTLAYRIIERFRLNMFKSKMYYDYTIFLDVLCESFTYYSDEDCKEGIEIFDRYISESTDQECSQSHFCVSKEFISVQIYDYMIKSAETLGVNINHLVDIGIFDDLLYNFISYAFFINSGKHKASILGIAGIIEIFKDKPDWVYYHLPSISSAITFYMANNHAKHKKIALHTFLSVIDIVDQFDVQAKTKASSDEERYVGNRHNRVNGVLVKRDIIEQLFKGLHSPYTNLRAFSYEVLRYYCKQKGILLRDLLQPYVPNFYTNINLKNVNSSLDCQLGFLDCFVFLAENVAIPHSDSQLYSILSPCLTSEFVVSLSVDARILKIKTKMFLLHQKVTDENIIKSFDYMLKHINNPACKSEKLTEYCRNAVSQIGNTNTVINYTNKLIKKSFTMLFLENFNVENNLAVCLAIVKIFQFTFTPEIISACMGFITNPSYELALKAIQILSYAPKLTEEDQGEIIQFILSTQIEFDSIVINFLEKHTYIIISILASLKNSSILILLKRMIVASPVVFEFLKTKILSIKQLLSENSQTFLNIFLLLAHLNYKFEQREIEFFCNRYDSIYFNEYTEFFNRALCYMPPDHLTRVYTIMPNIVFTKEAILGFYKTFGITEYSISPHIKNLFLKNLLHFVPFDVIVSSGKFNYLVEYAFENRIYSAELINSLKGSLSFIEMAYLAMYNPTPTLFKQIILYNEATTRIFEVLKKLPVNSYSFESCISEIFELPTLYKIHLMILMPFLIENPSLITPSILPRVIDSIYRLFGTASYKHKVIGAKLLFAACTNNIIVEDFNILFTQFFNFCIRSGDDEIISMFTKFKLNLTEDLDFSGDLNYISLAKCFAHEIKSNKSLPSYGKIFKALRNFLKDDNFDQIFCKVIFYYDLEYAIELLKTHKSHPLTAYSLIIYLFENHELFTVELSLVMEILNETINHYDNFKNFVNFDVILEIYPYEKNLEFLKFLGSLTNFIDSSRIYEEIISVLEKIEVTDFNFLNVSGESENFLTFVLYIFKNEKYSKFYEFFQKAFIKGLESPIHHLRSEFHILFDESISVDRLERLKYLFSFEWNLFSKNWYYTFLSLIISPDIRTDLLKIYCLGDDTFYEDIYHQETKRDRVRSSVDNSKYKLIWDFKVNSAKYLPKNLKETLLNICYQHEEVCAELLVRTIEAIVKSKATKEWIDEMEQIFRAFALDLKNIQRNSKLVDGIICIFGYFLLDVRIKHNCYYANIDGLPLNQRNQIYELTGESKFYYSSLSPALFNTKTAIENIILEKHDLAKENLQKSLELFTEENFDPEESLLIQSEWKKCLRELSQWDLLYEMGAALGDPSLEAESIFILRQTSPEIDNILPKIEDSFDKLVFEAINRPFDQDFEAMMYLGQVELSHSPSYSPKFINTLNKIQIILEIGEIQKEIKESLSEYKAIWGRREPASTEPLSNWNWYCAWRKKLFSIFSDDENKVIFQQELAVLMNKITKLARKNGNFETADFYNSQVFAIQNIRAADAYAKIYEENKLCLKNKEFENGLKKTRGTNITYFTNEQKGIIMGMAAELSKSDAAYRAAAQICPSNSKNWFNWGKFLESKFLENQESERTNSQELEALQEGESQRIENIFVSYLNAAIYSEKKNAFKPFLKCIKLFKYEDKANLKQYLQENINKIAYGSFSKFCNSLIEKFIETGSSCAEICIYKLIQHIPQLVFRYIKIHIDSLCKPTRISKANDDAVKKLQHIFFQSKFENCRTRLGLTMILSLCNTKMVFTPEQLAYSFLEYIYTITTMHIHEKKIRFDIKKTITRLINVVNLSNWTENVLNDFLNDFTCEKMTIVELALKTYKWIEIIENILKTYISNVDVDLSNSRLVDNLSDYEVLMFGHHEFCECSKKVFIDRFQPISALYINKQILARSVTVVGTDGKDYFFIVAKPESTGYENEKHAITLADLLDEEFRKTSTLNNSLFRFKMHINISYDLELIEFPEPIIIFGCLFDNYLGNKNRNTRMIFFEYLKAIEEIVKKPVYPGFERLEEYISIPYSVELNEEDNIANDDDNDVGIPHQISEQDLTEQINTPLIMENDFIASKKQRLKAYNKMLKICDKKILADGFKKLYGSSFSYFLFKKRSLVSYASVSSFFYALHVQPPPPDRLGVSLFSGHVFISNIFPFSPLDSNYFRLTPNIIELYGQEGLEAIFVSTADKIGKYFLKKEFVQDYLEVFMKADWMRVKNRLKMLVEGNVKEVMQRSMDPDEICMENVMWHPWF